MADTIFCRDTSSLAVGCCGNLECPYDHPSNPDQEVSCEGCDYCNPTTDSDSIEDNESDSKFPE